MELDIQVCRAIAIRYGLPLQFVVKEYYLMNVVGLVAAFSSSKPHSLVFKGGTAINKIYTRKTERFSEDADYDFVTKDAKTELLGFCKELAATMKGYRISEFRKVRGTVQFYCEYESPFGNRDHVRVDISHKKLITARPVESRIAVSGFTNASVGGVSVYSVEDIAARKFNALASRAEGKDVYDAHAIIELCDPRILRTAIEKALKSEGKEMRANEFISNIKSSVKKSDTRKQRNLTNPFIPVALRPKNWDELKEDLIMKLETL